MRARGHNSEREGTRGCKRSMEKHVRESKKRFALVRFST